VEHRERARALEEVNIGRDVLPFPPDAPPLSLDVSLSLLTLILPP